MLLQELIQKKRLDPNFNRDLNVMQTELFYVFADCGCELCLNEKINNFDFKLGASKVCLDEGDFILKKRIEGEIDDLDKDDILTWEREEDGVRIEYQIYKEAKKRKLDFFFADMEKLGCGVYAQQKIDYILDDYGFNHTDVFIDNIGFEYNENYEVSPSSAYDYVVSDEMGRKLDDLGLTELVYRFKDEMTFRAFFQFYTIDELKKLLSFLNEFDINDIHCANVGFVMENGEYRLKIFDYCGYGSTTAYKVRGLAE